MSDATFFWTPVGWTVIKNCCCLPVCLPVCQFGIFLRNGLLGMPKVPKIRSQTCWYCISLQYIQKNVGMMLIFCLQINAKVFYELIVSLWVCVARNVVPKVTSLLFLCNKWWSWFFHADKHESFLQTGVMIFEGNGQAFPKFPKKQVYNVFTISRKRNQRWI